MFVPLPKFLFLSKGIYSFVDFTSWFLMTDMVTGAVEGWVLQVPVSVVCCPVTAL